ncbi:hypothetical protein [Dictyobacter kobayashii]|uniref:hypothetical protein n=1 Tax=Dictyobacter kobayashii TaxID=2014872 RepID=UPI001C3F6FF1|nr:hypothetical protein [Dictyobacter kobayashii]
MVTEDGQEHEVDTIICGTGFHVTDAPFPQHVRGRHNQTLAEKWKPNPTAYLGTTIVDFPNLFLLIGPYTGLGHNSMIYMIESQINYILDCLRKMERRKVQAVEVQSEAQAAFDDEMQRRMQGTAWTSGCDSWYLNSTGRNTTIWPGFTFEFRYRTRRFDWQHYSHVARNSVAQPRTDTQPVG